MWVKPNSVGLSTQKSGLGSRRVLFTRHRVSVLNVSGDRERPVAACEHDTPSVGTLSGPEALRYTLAATRRPRPSSAAVMSWLSARLRNAKRSVSWFQIDYRSSGLTPRLCLTLYTSRNDHRSSRVDRFSDSFTPSYLGAMTEDFAPYSGIHGAHNKANTF
jgi:hypothetical protein